MAVSQSERQKLDSDPHSYSRAYIVRIALNTSRKLSLICIGMRVKFSRAK